MAIADSTTLSTTQDTPPLPVWELVCIVAGLMALNALAIDIMLPALSDMQAYFQLSNENAQQRVVVVYVVGLGLSQLFYGPLTDRFGRKPVLGWALLVYIIAALACLIAPSFELLLLARFIQGASAGATRVVATTIIRDFYSGRRMAEIMSVVMLIFAAAPILAPSIGLGVLSLFGNWHSVFLALAIYAFIVAVWSMVRLPETLKPENRTALRPDTIFKSYKSVFTNRISIGYMLASAFIFANLFSYIAASEQIYSDVFGIGASFPFWFAGVAGCMAISNLTNSKLVRSVGMRRLSHTALLVMLIANILHALLSISGHETFVSFYILMVISFLAMGFVGANFNATAMEPLGRIAGTGSALYGFTTTFGSGVIGGWIASFYDGTTGPLFVGNALALGAAFSIICLTERGRLFSSSQSV